MKSGHFDKEKEIPLSKESFHKGGGHKISKAELRFLTRAIRPVLYESARGEVQCLFLKILVNTSTMPFSKGSKSRSATKKPPANPKKTRKPKQPLASSAPRKTNSQPLPGVALRSANNRSTPIKTANVINPDAAYWNGLPMELKRNILNSLPFRSKVQLAVVNKNIYKVVRPHRVRKGRNYNYVETIGPFTVSIPSRIYYKEYSEYEERNINRANRLDRIGKLESALMFLRDESRPGDFWQPLDFLPKTTGKVYGFGYNSFMVRINTEKKVLEMTQVDEDEPVRVTMPATKVDTKTLTKLYSFLLRLPRL